MTRMIVSPLVLEVLEHVEALALEVGVADGEDLVEQHDVALGLQRGGKAQAGAHAGRQVLQLGVAEAIQAGELDRVLHALARLAARVAEDGGVQLDVLAHRQLGAEAEPELEQRRHRAVDAHRALVRQQQAGDDLQQRRLAGAVAADDTDEGAALDRQGDAAQRLEALVRDAAKQAQDALGQRGVHLVRDAEGLVKAGDLDRGGHQKCSTTRACSLRKTAYPTMQTPTEMAVVMIRPRPPGHQP